MLLMTLLMVAGSLARPQRQLFYYQTPVQQPTGYYYLPQSAVPSYEPMPGPGSGPGQYVLLYAGPPQHQAPFLLRQTPPGEESVGEENETAGPALPPSWWQTVVQSFGGFRPGASRPPVVAPAEEATPTPTPTPGVAPAEETTPPSAPPDKPEKVVEMMIADELNNDMDRVALEDLGEEVPVDSDEPEYGNDEVAEPTGTPPPPPPPSPRTPAVAAGGGAGATQHFVAVQEPQFFGNYDLLQRGAGQVGQKNSDNPNFLLFRNQPHGYQFPQPFPYSHHQTPLLQHVHAHAYPGVTSQERGAFIPGQRHVDLSERVGQYVTSQNAPQQSLQREFGSTQPHQPEVQAFQNLPSQPGLINVGPGYQSVYYITARKSSEDGDAVTVDAGKGKKEDNTTGDNATATVTDEQAGPSVAQAKPQAIALAGAGGVAAATPVATAVVGPGGLAVAAPTATAVAGPSGGGALPVPAAAALNKYFSTMKQKDAHGVVAYSQ